MITGSVQFPVFIICNALTVATLLKAVFKLVHLLCIAESPSMSPNPTLRDLVALQYKRDSTTALNEAVLHGHMETVTMLVKLIQKGIYSYLTYCMYHLLLSVSPCVGGSKMPHEVYLR